HLPRDHRVGARGGRQGRAGRAHRRHGERHRRPVRREGGAPAHRAGRAGGAVRGAHRHPRHAPGSRRDGGRGRGMSGDGLASMADRYSRPDWVRRVNAMAGAAGGAERVVPLVADHLLEHTAASTGVDDPGDLGDGDWEGRLRRLVDGINASRLHVVGRLLTREELLRGLRTRFLLGEARRQDPTIAAERIEAPIVVTGPARSGTTILFELLGLDERLRTPIARDVLHPVVPPGTTTARRTAMTEPEQELWADVQPEFAAMHELRSD